MLYSVRNVGVARKDLKLVRKNIRNGLEKGTQHRNGWEERIKGHNDLQHGVSKCRTRATNCTPTIVNRYAAIMKNRNTKCINI